MISGSFTFLITFFFTSVCLQYQCSQSYKQFYADVNSFTKTKLLLNVLQKQLKSNIGSFSNSFNSFTNTFILVKVVQTVKISLQFHKTQVLSKCNCQHFPPPSLSKQYETTFETTSVQLKILQMMNFKFL
jgi:hypothetical protein